jgi:NADPH:quinone reductase-like Zn-dependent oxidoreductase
MRAVRFSRYGGPEVLEVVDVPRPVPGPGEVLVAVAFADINPGEVGIREGVYAAIWPATFPEGHGNTAAGHVVEVGPDVHGFAVGDPVTGFAPRATHAELAIIPATALVAKPPELPWEVAPSLTGIGATAWAMVEAVGVARGETVVVSGAAGGVGHVAAQLAAHRGAVVLGTAHRRNEGFLRSVGVIPVEYGDGLAARIAALAPHGADAWLDTAGRGSVALAVQLGVDPRRIATIADGGAAQRYGTRTDAQVEGFSPAVVTHLAELVVGGDLTIPIAAVYPLDRIRDAYERLAKGHVDGRIVLQIARPND